MHSDKPGLLTSFHSSVSGENKKFRANEELFTLDLKLRLWIRLRVRQKRTTLGDLARATFVTLKLSQNVWIKLCLILEA